MQTDVTLTEADFEADDPRLALRRHTDRCFLRVEEVAPLPPSVGCVNQPAPGVRGVLLGGVMIDVEEEAELRRTGDDGGPLLTCVTPGSAD